MAKAKRRAAVRYSEAGAAAYQLLRELERGADFWRAPVSHARLAALRVLATQGEMNIAQLARARRISRQGAHGIVRALLQAGWVENTAGASAAAGASRKRALLRPTAAGLAAYHKLAHAEAAKLNELARGLDAEQIRAAARVVQKLRARAADAAAAAAGSKAAGA